MDSFDDDSAFWDEQRPEPTIRIDRVRRRSPERTRSHRVVERTDSPPAGARPADTGSRRYPTLDPRDDLESDARDTIWLEASYRGMGRRRGARAGGPFGAIDPRLLSVGAIAVAAVLAVPLFGALSDKSPDQDSFLSVAEADTTTTTSTVPAPSSSVVIITAALNPVEADQSDSGSASYGADDAGASSSTGNSDSAGNAESSGSDGGSSGGRSAASGFSGGSGEATLAAPAVRPPAQCGNPYEVQAGDFWVAIADAVGVSLDDLLDYNEATSTTPIYPGSTVCLPLGTSVTTSTVVATTIAPATTSAPSSTAPATTAVVPSSAPATDAPTTPPPAPPTTAEPQTTTATTQPADNDNGGGGIPLPTDPVPSGGEVEQMIRDIWPDDLEDQALRIAWRESNFRPDVTSSTGCCVGVFQLHWEAHNGWMAQMGITSRDQLFDARTNIQAAYALYQRSGGWGAWQ